MSVSRISMAPNGPQVSRFIAGYWRLKHWGWTSQQLLNFIEQHLELGITTVDHAMVYSSESLFGEALALKPELREQLEIVTKCGIRPAGMGPLGAKDISHFDSRKESIIESVDHSLRNLRTDYIDVLLIHRPDFLMSGIQIADAFKDLKAQGKVRHFGVSNFTTHQFDYLQDALGDELLVTNQIELSPYNMQALEQGTLEQCARRGVSPMLWSCLAGGQLLTPQDEKGVRLAAALERVAAETGADALEQVVYAWVLALPFKMLPLLGTSKIERMRTAVAAAELPLTHEQWYAIWEASNGAPVP